MFSFKLLRGVAVMILTHEARVHAAVTVAAFLCDDDDEVAALTVQGSASAVAEAQASGFARAVADVSVDCFLSAPSALVCCACSDCCACWEDGSFLGSPTRMAVRTVSHGVQQGSPDVQNAWERCIDCCACWERGRA